MAKSARRAPDGAADVITELFAARLHEAWRKQSLKANPEQRGQPRMRMRGGIMVDINQPWSRLHPNAKADNRQAAEDAYAAVAKFPNDREAAADYVHKCWIKRNRRDKSLAKELFKPYGQLSEVEKDKDRAHVDLMRKAVASVRKSAKAVTPRKAKAPTFKVVRVDAKSWARLETAARRLSRQTGAAVSPEALLAAGIDAIVAVSDAILSEAKPKKR